MSPLFGGSLDTGTVWMPRTVATVLEFVVTSLVRFAGPSELLPVHAARAGAMPWPVRLLAEFTPKPPPALCGSLSPVVGDEANGASPALPDDWTATTIDSPVLETTNDIGE